ncbi:MPN domain-containing protein [Zancudomyces culisetae]|uniref:MPN domain-containing protein n=1 Tax=Zancudomyces culisetae TaxID=1213189 RepID=A0A1R1PFI5_ZANCU|nr:MPN domain-containing protein [Zancudomyces culisetae]OMH80644.1 MPN domain-containing protein [Zancudomyces culisetae]|eukprot:OMH79622.1 MPN domain-containing protein [Zancudomyces culisetae]
MTDKQVKPIRKQNKGGGGNKNGNKRRNKSRSGARGEKGGDDDQEIQVADENNIKIVGGKKNNKNNDELKQEEEERLSSELIAKLLAADEKEITKGGKSSIMGNNGNGYYKGSEYGYGYGYEYDGYGYSYYDGYSSDNSTGEGKSKRRKRRGSKNHVDEDYIEDPKSKKCNTRGGNSSDDYADRAWKPTREGGRGGRGRGGKRGSGGGKTKRGVGERKEEVENKASEFLKKPQADSAKGQTESGAHENEENIIVDGDSEEKKQDPEGGEVIDILNSTSNSSAGSARSSVGDIDVTTHEEGAQKQKKIEEAGYNVGTYSVQEEEMFLRGLDLYGRNWKQLSQFMKTRCPKSIRSHAQKHFIKLYRDNKPLPDKVKESGEGYTLSGKPLDPNSTSARVYLHNTNSEESGGRGKDTKSKNKREGSKDEEAEIDIESTEKNEKENITKKTEKERVQHKNEYVMARPKRQRKRPAIQIDHDNDPHSLVKCSSFVGEAGSGELGSQPYRLTIHSNVEVTMDIHAHLMTTEIIGLLGGTYDGDSKTVTVKQAFPCKALSHDEVNVEMDPESELQVRQQISECQLQVVGWYHSHPTFVPLPSRIDIDNQYAYQSLFSNDTANALPFVGAIVGPYDPNLPKSVSAINWFAVVSTKSEAELDDSIPFVLIPKRLSYNVVNDSEYPADLLDRACQLVQIYKSHPQKTDFSQTWKPKNPEQKLFKLLLSLASRMVWVSSQSPDNRAINNHNKKDNSDNSNNIRNNNNSGNDSGNNHGGTPPTPADIDVDVEIDTGAGTGTGTGIGAESGADTGAESEGDADIDVGSTFPSWISSDPLLSQLHSSLSVWS